MSSKHSKPSTGRVTPLPDRGDRSSTSGSTIGKGFQKIHPAGLPQIHVTSGPIITQIRDAIQIFCQREIGPISDIFTDGKYFTRPETEFGSKEILEDLTGILKARLLSRLKTEDTEDLLYEKSKAKLHAVLSSITTKELDERILSYVNTIEDAEREVEPKSLKVNSTTSGKKKCPLFLWQCITHVTTTKVIGNYIVDQDNVSMQYATLRQRQGETVVEYKTRFENIVQSHEAVQLDVPSQSSQARRFTQGLDNSRFESMKTSFANGLTNGTDIYPKDLDDAATRATKWISPPNSGAYYPPTTHHPTFFSPKEKPAGKRNEHKVRDRNADKPTIEKSDSLCDFCGRTGHVMEKCFKFIASKKTAKERTASHESSKSKLRKPTLFSKLEHDSDDDDFPSTPALHTIIMSDSILAAGSRLKFSESEIILDTGASGSLTNNRKLLDFPLPARPITFAGIGGALRTKLAGPIGDLCTAYYHQDAPANIISFSQLQDMGHDIKYNKTKSEFTVTTPSRTYVFNKTSSGLYVCDLKSLCTLMATVSTNESMFTKREVSKAKLARELQERLANPPDQRLMKAISHGNIVTDAVLPADIERASTIYGPNTNTLQGRTTTKKATTFPSPSLPRATDPQSLYADIFTANTLSFLITVAKPLEHILTTHIELKDTTSLRKAFRAHLGFYGQRRINVSHIFSDNERGIAALAPQFAGAGIQLTHCGPGMHVHVVERAIRYIKEGARSILAGLPYTCPRILFRHLIPFTALRLNLFPNSTRSDNLSAFQLL